MVCRSFCLPFKALSCLLFGLVIELDVLGHFAGFWLRMSAGLGIPVAGVAEVLFEGELMSNTGATGLLLSLLLDSAACRQDVLGLMSGGSQFGGRRRKVIVSNI